jgi:hypothetical protein
LVGEEFLMRRRSNCYCRMTQISVKILWYFAVNQSTAPTGKKSHGFYF